MAIYHYLGYIISPCVDVVQYEFFVLQERREISSGTHYVLKEKILVLTQEFCLQARTS
jgi:hypothetical protein